MPNAWIDHIFDYADKKNITFGCALSNPNCLATYRKKKSKKLQSIKNT